MKRYSDWFLDTLGQTYRDALETGNTLIAQQIIAVCKEIGILPLKHGTKTLDYCGEDDRISKTSNIDGGAGSGNWGHVGRPGKRGGSGKGGGKQNRTGSKETGFSSAAKERAKSKASGASSNPDPAGAKIASKGGAISCESSVGYTVKQQADIEHMLEKSPKEIKSLYDQYGWQLKPAVEDVGKGNAFYNPDEARVHMLRSATVSGSDYEAPYDTHFHEYGHNLDYLAGDGTNPLSRVYRDQQGRSFEEIINSDWDAALKEHYKNSPQLYMKQFEANCANSSGMGAEMYVKYSITNWRKSNHLSHSDPAYTALRDEFDGLSGTEQSYREFYRRHIDKFIDQAYDKVNIIPDYCQYMKANYKPRELSDISDMFEPYSVHYYGKSGERPFGYGHGSDYALYGGKQATETFAEMTSATICCPESAAMIQKFLPNAYKAYFDMLKGAAK